MGESVHEGFCFCIFTTFFWKWAPLKLHVSKAEGPNGWNAGSVWIGLRWSCILAKLNGQYSWKLWHDWFSQVCWKRYRVRFESPSGAQVKATRLIRAQAKAVANELKKDAEEWAPSDGLALGLFSNNAAMVDSKMSQILTLSVGRCRVAA